MSGDLRVRLKSAMDRAAAQLTRRKRTAAAFQANWNNPDGRIVLQDVINFCGLLTDVEAPSDADMRAYLDGRRSVAIHIFERMRFSDIELAELAREQDNDRMAQIVEAG